MSLPKDYKLNRYDFSTIADLKVETDRFPIISDLSVETQNSAERKTKKEKL